PLLPAEEAEWKNPVSSYKYEFPRDHGSHPDYRIEWWYLTGHLKGKDQHRYGFEATFFRVGQAKDQHLYMAHMAVTDIDDQRFFHEERLNREGWNAFSKVGDLDVKNGNWSLKREADTLRLQGSVRSECLFNLKLTPAKPHVIFGETGISKKGPSPSAASHYITFTRLITEGVLTLDGEEFAVEGSTWMDHEISSSQLDEDQVGWDWTSVQLDDGREIMAYVLRERDGDHSEYSKLVWIGKDGALTHQKQPSFQWKPDGIWKSEATGATYPIEPSFTTIDPLDGRKRTFRLAPLMKEQEMPGNIGGVPYWEGACDVLDETGNRVGQAYLELSGYAGDLNARLR
ncbi:MAG: lipocalin-like domain-containing protein, partial [Verrucomicrobiota bacterium]